jgi:phage FluMu gp28-like protein
VETVTTKPGRELKLEAKQAELLNKNLRKKAEAKQNSEKKRKKRKKNKNKNSKTKRAPQSPIQNQLVGLPAKDQREDLLPTQEAKPTAKETPSGPPLAVGAQSERLPVKDQQEDAVAIGKEKPAVGNSAIANPEPGDSDAGLTIPESATLEVFDPDLVNSAMLRPYQVRWSQDPARFAVAVKSAQIGFSTATAAWAVDRCLLLPLRTIIFLSRSERQSRELAEKAKQWLRGYKGAIGEYSSDRYFEGTSMLQHEIRFPNGSRIIVLAANPDTARGYTGDVVLDEFAFHQDSQSIFTAVYRQVSLGYSMRILSTPNGPQGKFYELAKSLNFDTGERPDCQPVKTGAWSGHWVDIHLAVEEGCPLDVGLVEAGCDQQTWLQEYCCQFVSEGSTWIPPELYQQCVSSEATSDFGFWISDFGLKKEDAVGMGSSSLIQNPNSKIQNPTGSSSLIQNPKSNPQNPTGSSSLIQNPNSKIQNPTVPGPKSLDPILYAGWDIARNHDLSVIWLTELLGDVTWTRGVVEMRNMPTPDQIREARALMPFIRRMEIDKGGMGLAIYEALERDFPGQVEGIQFTAAKKETMAVLAKRRMEEGKVRLPDRDQIRQSFRAVRKSVNALGQARFDAEHDAHYGHADHWWAFCLAEAAAEQPAYRLRQVGAVVGAPVIAGFRSTGLVPSEAESMVPSRALEFPT